MENHMIEEPMAFEESKWAQSRKRERGPAHVSGRITSPSEPVRIPCLAGCGCLVCRAKGRV